LPPRLTIVSQYYWPELIGSAPYITDLAEWMAARGYAVDVVTSRPHYPSPDDYSDYADGRFDEQTRNGVRIHRITAGRSGSSATARLKADVGFALKALRHARRIGRADHVVTLVPSCLSILAGAAYARAGVTPTALIHDIESGLAAATGLAKSAPLMWLMRAAERLCFARAGRIAVLSGAMRQVLHRSGVTRPIAVIPIWIHRPPAFVPERPDGERLRVMYSGNFGRKQGLDSVLDLAERIRDSHPEVEILMQGDGSERKRLEEQAARRGLRNVRFAGLVPIEELAASLAKASVHLVVQAAGTASYVIPSKIMSVMAVGRPMVVMADADSPTRTVLDEAGCGLAVAPDDVGALADAVTRLLADPALREEMGRRASAYALSTYEREAVLGRFEALLTADGAGDREAPVLHPIG
jgi:colanic acid biosynthesis glycosyl transferase WcaI